MSLVTILKGQIAETENRIVEISQPIRNQILALEQQIKDLQTQKEDTKQVSQIITGYRTEKTPIYAGQFFTAATTLSARYQDPLRIIGTREQRIPITQAVVTYDPQYDIKIQQTQAQIQQLQAQLHNSIKPFSDSLNAYLTQLKQINTDNLTPNQNNTSQLGKILALTGLLLVADS